MADPECFDADPDPTFQVDVDPTQDLDPNPFTRVRNFSLLIFNYRYCFKSLPKLVMCNFLSKNAGERVRDKGRVIRGEG